MSFMQDEGPAGLTVIMCFAFDHRAAFDELARFKKALADCPHIADAMEVSGTFDYIVQAHLEDLQDYHAQLVRLAKPMRELVKSFETCFVAKTNSGKSPETTIFYPSSFWIPCSEGFKRVDISAVNKIKAEGDYMRLHLGADTCLMHTTEKGLLAKLDPAVFIQVHRSTIVRREFILRLLHQGRVWSAYLKDGSTVIISKSHVKDALSRLCDHEGAEPRNAGTVLPLTAAA